MSQQDRTVLLESAYLKDGVSQKTGKAYERTVVSWKGEDGSDLFASSFGNGLYEHAKPLEGAKAILTLEQKGDFLNLVAIRPAPVEKDPPKPGTGEYVTGQKPAIEQRRMCALNASTNATAMTAALLSFQTSQQITPELYKAAWDAMYDHCFYKNLRSCKIMEDDDIPFG